MEKNNEQTYSELLGFVQKYHPDAYDDWKEQCSWKEQDTSEDEDE